MYQGLIRIKDLFRINDEDFGVFLSSLNSLEDAKKDLERAIEENSDTYEIRSEVVKRVKEIFSWEEKYNIRDFPYKGGVQPIPVNEGISRIEQIIFDHKEEKLLSIGIAGRYGAGKTNLVEMLRSRLNRTRKRKPKIRYVSETGPDGSVTLPGFIAYLLRELRDEKRRQVAIVDYPEIDPNDVDYIVLVETDPLTRMRRLFNRLDIPAEALREMSGLTKPLKVYDPTLELANDVLQKYKIDTLRPFAGIVIDNTNEGLDLINYNRVR